DVPQANPAHSACGGSSTDVISEASGAEMSCFIAVRTSTLFGGRVTCFGLECDCRLGLIEKSTAKTPDSTSQEAMSRDIRRVDMSVSGGRLPLDALESCRSHIIYNSPRRGVSGLEDNAGCDTRRRCAAYATVGSRPSIHFRMSLPLSSLRVAC